MKLKPIRFLALFLSFLISFQPLSSASSFQTTTYTYTALDQLKTITDHQSNLTTFQYDPNGNRKKIIDAELKETNYLYDERDLLYQVTDANTGVTTYSYDANGNLSSIKDANTNTTTYQYDEFDRLTSTVYPDSSSESYTYDPASNLTQIRNPKSEIRNYVYDELNRLTFKEYVGCALSLCGGDVDYVYDEGSRLDLVLNSLTSIDYNYDALNRVKDVTTTLNASPFTLHYQYDASSNRSELQYPHGRITKYTYDELNRLDQIKDSTNQMLYDFDYDELSRRTSLSRPNSVNTTYAYDTLNRLTQMNHGSVGSISYPLYDKVGNRKQMTNSLGTHNYTYDNIYQLTQASGPQASSYTYDAAGNRLQATGTGIPSSYTPNNLNQYSSVDGTSYSYDLNGNLTSDGTRTYSYDFENRLTEIRNPQSEIIASYQYDPFGRRLTKTIDGNTTTFLYDGDQILEVFPCLLPSASCLLSQSFLSGPSIDEPLEIVQHPSTTTYYFHQDGLGSITHLTNSSGVIQESYTYDAYGIPSTTSSLGNPYLFTGREYDQETGFYFYRSRYNSAKLGRFIQRDLLGLLDNINIYSYVANNPVNWIDPYGLEKASKDKQIPELFDPAVPPLPPQGPGSPVPTGGGIGCIVGGPCIVVPPIGGIGGIPVPHGGILTKGGGEKSKRPQIFIRFPTRKKAQDARDRIGKPGGKANKPERHKGGSTHFHDKNHNDPRKPNIHYIFPD